MNSLNHTPILPQQTKQGSQAQQQTVIISNNDKGNSEIANNTKQTMPQFWKDDIDQDIEKYTKTHGEECAKNIIKSVDENNERQAREADIIDNSTLPELPKELISLPSGLGILQNYILGTMDYPCRYTAGWTAITTMTAFVQTHITIDSRAGLSLNEYYITLAPTGFGKEALRDPLNKILDILKKDCLYGSNFPIVEYSAPSSKQGLHQILQETQNHSVYIQSDEFAEWLKSSNKDPSKAAVLEYLMQIYSKGLRMINPGRAITNNYTPIQNPRLSIFATTTAESILTAINKKSAEMGAYNRWVIFVAPQIIPIKNYERKNYEPSKDIIQFIKWLVELKPLSISMQNAFKTFISYDQKYAEPIKQKDALLGARLSEQAIKMAGLFALSNGRTVIEPQDIQLAYKIRLGLYYRSKALIDENSVMSDIPEINEAFEQIKNVCEKNEILYISSFEKRSRVFHKLKLPEQELVIKILTSRGIIEKDPLSKKRVKSLIFNKIK